MRRDGTPIAGKSQKDLVGLHQGNRSRAVMKSLSEIVDRYSSLATSFGEPVALAAFAFSTEETQALFSALDEDYHISRFLHFSCVGGSTFLVSGEPATHVSIEPAIRSLL